MLNYKLTMMMFMRVEKHSKINAICCDDLVSTEKMDIFSFIVIIWYIIVIDFMTFL